LIGDRLLRVRARLNRCARLAFAQSIIETGSFGNAATTTPASARRQPLCEPLPRRDGGQINCCCARIHRGR
jgi:hypothetical protein